MAKSLVVLLFVALALPTQAASQGWQTPQIGSRTFLVVGSVLGEKIDGISYPYLTAFDILGSDTASVKIVTARRQHVDLNLKEHPNLKFSRVPWDTANNVPFGGDAPNQYFVRYYHFMTIMLTRPWFFVLSLLLAIGACFAAFATGKDRGGLVLIVVLPILLVLGFGAYMGNGYLRYLETYNAAVSWLAPYRTAGIHFLPVRYSFINPEQAAGDAAGPLYLVARLIWVPLFLVVHILFIRSIPSIIRGLHYLFVPHPAEKHLVTALAGKALNRKAVVGSMGRGNLDNPPPAWVSKNQKERIGALRDKFKAETGVLNAVIDWKRKKEEVKDQ